MPNTSEKRNSDHNTSPYLNTQANWGSGRTNVQSLMKRLKKNKQKENIEKFIFMMTAIGILVISGIIISL